MDQWKTNPETEEERERNMYIAQQLRRIQWRSRHKPHFYKDRGFWRCLDFSPAMPTYTEGVGWLPTAETLAGAWDDNLRLRLTARIENSRWRNY